MTKPRKVSSLRSEGCAAFVAISVVALFTACGTESAPDLFTGGAGGATSTSGGGGTASATTVAATAATGVTGAGGSSSGAGGAGGDGSGATSGPGGSGGTGGSATGGAGTAGGSGGTAGGGAGGAAGASVADGGALEPAVGAYGRRAPLLASNSEMAVAALDGKIYVLGGYPSSRVVQSTVQVYDPALDKWAFTVPLPVPMHHPVAVGVGGKLYSLGGQLDASDTNRTLVLDPAAPSPAWADLAPMPTARGAGAGAVIGDKIYVAGGRPPAGNAFEVYDVSDNAWTALADLPPAFANRNHIAAAAIGGKVYVAGGRYNGGSFSDPITASLDVFDPATGMWQPRAPMLRPRGGVNGVAAYGCFYVWGGEGAANEPNGVFPDHDVYNPVTNVWTPLSRLPTPVHGVTGAAFVDGLIYVPGGGTAQGGSSGSTIFQVYRPSMRCE